MRLICTIANPKQENPFEFSYYLSCEGIKNQCEEVSTPEGTLFHIWVYDEDQVEKAQELYYLFQSDPQNIRYRVPHPSPLVAPNTNAMEDQEPEADRPQKTKRRSILSPAPYGAITIFILCAAILLFFGAQLQRHTLLPPKLPGIIQAPVLAPLERTLLFDYPTYFQLRDKLLTLYTSKQIEEGESPSTEALQLLNQLRTMPVWMGVYDRFLNHIRHPDKPLIDGGTPVFEKIKSGELWRLFTPALLHFDLLHIFFNLLWFIMLGNQIEYRLGRGRYLLFILITGISSNIAQYLMSGPFFMGLSGIVVGMAAFIWARQQKAPWEGYLLQRFTLIFLAIFVLGMFFLQLVFFVLQLSGKFELTIGIANTAHLVGALVGYLLGRLPFFAIKHTLTK